MLQFKSISMRNFLSFGNADVEITFNEGLWLILGRNNDVEDSRNGSGKSSILNALTYVLFDKTRDKVKVDNLKNKYNSSHPMEVTLKLSCGKSEYEITRGRHKSKPIIRIVKDSEDVTLAGPTEANNYISNLIKISYDLFTMIFAFDSNNHFMNKDGPAQKAILEEILNIQLLTVAGSSIKRKTKEYESNTKILEATVIERKNTKALLEKNLEEIKAKNATWDTDRFDKVAEISKEINSFDIDAINAELSNHSKLKQEIAEFDNMIRDCNSEIEKRKYKISSLEKSIVSAEKEIKSINLQGADIESKIETLNSSKCPTCKQSLCGNNAELISSEENKLVKLSDRLDVLEASIAEFNEQIDIEKNDMLSIENEINDVKLKSAEVKKDISELADINELNHLIKEYNRLCNSLEYEQKATNPYTDNIAKYEKQLEDINLQKLIDELDNNRYLHMHSKLAQSLLLDTDSSLRKNIIRQYISRINHSLNKYTRELGLAHLCEFTPDLDIELYNDGFSYSYGNLSAGEARRLNIALTFTFNEFFINSNFIDLIFCDEIDGGVLDDDGNQRLGRLLNAFNSKGLKVYIISHNQLLCSRIANQILVEKTGGFSEIKYLE